MHVKYTKREEQTTIIRSDALFELNDHINIERASSSVPTETQNAWIKHRNQILDSKKAPQVALEREK